MKLITLFTLCFCFAFFIQAQEGVLNKLFAPGPLIEGHKDLEKDGCLKCHDVNAGVPNKNCLECHEDIKEFVVEKRGFHGMQKKRCFECHSDHKGNNHDTTYVDIDNFDHNSTGYKLTGKHADIKCAECHKEKRSKKHVRKSDIRFLGLTSTCKECHKKDDIHYFKGKFKKKDCNACHGTKTWKDNLKFNHNSDTKFRLVGNHAQLKCTDCHITNKKKKVSKYHWKNLKYKQCLSCHQDVHGKRISKKFSGGKCLTCHSQTQRTWEIKQFDHKKITGFRLRGEHAKINCTDCHKQTKRTLNKGKKFFNWKGLKSSCISCHGDKKHGFYKHKSTNGLKLQSCNSCHNEVSWKKNIKFNHNQKTKFRIDGKHVENKCNDCHKPTRKKKGIVIARKYHWKQLSTKTCNVCHKSPHEREFSPKFKKKKCTECHVTRGWHISPKDAKKNFNHNETRFKLTGKHRTVSCNTCHVVNGKQKFKYENPKSGFCIDCHKNPHKSQFHKKFSQQSCTECHTTERFNKRKKFDHGETAFDLKGSHKKLECKDCHTPTEKKRVTIFNKKSKIVQWHKYIFKNLKADSCKTCHKDVHRGQLGNNCIKCHNEKSWKKVDFDHNRDSIFKLKGKHAKAKCTDCHKPIAGKYVKEGKKKINVIRYKPMKTDCYSCHKKDDKHKGSFGKKCQSCHNENGWKIVKDFHKYFSLSGVHYSLECSECHSDNRKLSGMSQNCVLCHQKDDVHSGQLFDCTECHRQNFWEHTKFRHSVTNFPLRGTHRTLDCFECHSGGVYTGLSNSCTNCHTNSVDNSVFNHNTIIGVQDCNECHNQFTFDK